MSKNINGALKNLFLELGGNSSALADNSKISDYIDDIAEILSAPFEEFDITATYNSETEQYSIDKTAVEISEAVASGKKIFLIPNFDNFNADSNKIQATVFASGALGFTGTLYGGSDDFYLMSAYVSANLVDIYYSKLSTIYG